MTLFKALECSQAPAGDKGPVMPSPSCEVSKEWTKQNKAEVLPQIPADPAQVHTPTKADDALVLDIKSWPQNLNRKVRICLAMLVLCMRSVLFSNSS